jgi:hypothetical protein
MTTDELPKYRREMIDYPTGWAIQRRGIEHIDPRCSAVQTAPDGDTRRAPFLCDCGAIIKAWELMHEREDFDAWLLGSSTPSESTEGQP